MGQWQPSDQAWGYYCRALDSCNKLLRTKEGMLVSGWSPDTPGSGQQMAEQPRPCQCTNPEGEAASLLEPEFRLCYWICSAT